MANVPDRDDDRVTRTHTQGPLQGPLQGPREGRPQVVRPPEVSSGDQPRATERRLVEALDELPAFYVLMDPVHDRSGGVVDFRIAYANRAAANDLHLRPDELVGRRLLQLLPEYAVSGMFRRCMGVFETGRTLVLSGVQYRGVAGGTFRDRWYDVSAYRSEGSVALSMREVTARVLAHRQRRADDQRLHTVMHGAPVGFATVAFDGELVEVNRALCRLLGRESDDLVGRSVGELVHPHDRGAMEDGLWRVVRGDVGQVGSDHRWLRGDGTVLWANVTMALVDVTDRDGTPCVVAQWHDVGTAKQTRDFLTYRALHDPLTGLPNRTLVLDRLVSALARTRRTGTQVAVMFCDLDHLKEINDRLGHDAGDQVLVAAAGRLTASLRETDTAGRFGGDEFVVVSEGVTDREHAQRMAERLRRAVYEPLEVAGQSLRPTLSVGVAVTGEPDADPSVLLRQADTAMYRAKRTGGTDALVFE